MKNSLYALLKKDEKQIRSKALQFLTHFNYETVAVNDYILGIGDVPVLLLAHYDIVPKHAPNYIFNENGILSSRTGLGADDRAGMYAIFEIIREHRCHVLFCGGEELGGVGSSRFVSDLGSGCLPQFEVNYCIQLDRRGQNDAVYYRGQNADFEEFVNGFGWQTAAGSFTDICNVCPALGVMGVNLSIGYQNEHTVRETLDTAVLYRNIERVKKMLEGPRFEWQEGT